jgi:SAM-dependent methyltransferase
VQSLYQPDLAYIQAVAFEGLAVGAAPEIVRRLRSSKSPIRRILDVGCGSGVLTKALTDAGFDVVGVDPSCALLEIARAKVPNARFIHGSAYDVATADFDAVIAVGEPLTYHAEIAAADRCVQRFFESVAMGMPTGGMLIFDVIGLGQPFLNGRSWRCGDDWAVLVATTEEQSERTLVREIETFRRVGEFYRRNREIHKVRLFDIAVLRDQLAVLGFAVESSERYDPLQLPPRRHAFFATRTDERAVIGRRRMP